MPSRYTIRRYSPESFYHVYNRGVEKRVIFHDTRDYTMFQYYLFIYLAPPVLIQSMYPDIKPKLQQGNMHGSITLHSYVLMKNHFHLLLHQREVSNVSDFMKRLSNAYTKYFNDRNKRVGSLFQGVYKAIIIEEDEYLLHLTKYIHTNPLKYVQSTEELSTYRWSSYPVYLNNKVHPYLETEYIKQFFSQDTPNTYKNFVEESRLDDDSLPSDLTIE